MALNVVPITEGVTDTVLIINLSPGNRNLVKSNVAVIEAAAVLKVNVSLSTSVSLIYRPRTIVTVAPGTPATTPLTGMVPLIR